MTACKARWMIAVVALPNIAFALTWRTDVQQAAQEARQAGKLVLVNIHTSWCGPCRALQATTLKDPSLQKAIDQNCVPVSLDGDQHQSLLVRWGVESFPTQLILDPTTGAAIGKIEGFVEPAKYQSVLSASVQRWQSRQPSANNSSLAARNTVSPAPTAAIEPTPARPTPKIDPEVKPCDLSAPLALGGYCPVRMILGAELTVGKEEYCVVYRGMRFLCSSKQEKDRFEQSPMTYMPAEQGRCVVTHAESGRWAQGNIDYPAIFGDHVFFFANDQQRRKFLQDPEQFADRTSGRSLR